MTMLVPPTNYRIPIWAEQTSQEIYGNVVKMYKLTEQFPSDPGFRIRLHELRNDFFKKRDQELEAREKIEEERRKKAATKAQAEKEAERDRKLELNWQRFMEGYIFVGPEKQAEEEETRQKEAKKIARKEAELEDGERWQNDNVVSS
ncbi:Hypothetical predicted protein, partial [Paramuricea clavata]